MTVHYKLGNRIVFKKNTGPIVVIDNGPIGGIAVYARDERAGNYIHVLETAPDIYVDGEAQSYSVGNFADKESAQKFASMAYRWINKNHKAT